MGFKFNPIYGTLDLVGTSSSGDVVGPAGATDKAIARYDGTTGKLIQNSKTILQDGGAIEAQGFITRSIVDDDVVVHTDEAWIAPSLVLDVGGSIVMEAESELIIV